MIKSSPTRQFLFTLTQQWEPQEQRELQGHQCYRKMTCTSPDMEPKLFHKPLQCSRERLVHSIDFNCDIWYMIVRLLTCFGKLSFPTARDLSAAEFLVSNSGADTDLNKEPPDPRPNRCCCSPLRFLNPVCWKKRCLLSWILPGLSFHTENLELRLEEEDDQSGGRSWPLLLMVAAAVIAGGRFRTLFWCLRPWSSSTLSEPDADVKSSLDSWYSSFWSEISPSMLLLLLLQRSLNTWTLPTTYYSETDRELRQYQKGIIS